MYSNKVVIVGLGKPTCCVCKAVINGSILQQVVQHSTYPHFPFFFFFCFSIIFQIIPNVSYTFWLLVTSDNTFIEKYPQFHSQWWHPAQNPYSCISEVEIFFPMHVTLLFIHSEFHFICQLLNVLNTSVILHSARLSWITSYHHKLPPHSLFTSFP